MKTNKMNVMDKEIANVAIWLINENNATPTQKKLRRVISKLIEDFYPTDEEDDVEEIIERIARFVETKVTIKLNAKEVK